MTAILNLNMYAVQQLRLVISELLIQKGSLFYDLMISPGQKSLLEES